MERLTVLCFAGTYGLALASDLARLVVRGQARWYLTVGLTALGWAVHTAFLGNLAYAPARACRSRPSMSRYWSCRGSWRRSTCTWSSDRPSRWPSASSSCRSCWRWRSSRGSRARVRAGAAGAAGLKFWGTVHGLLLLAGAVSTCVAFAAGLMYLAQANRLKQKRPSRFGPRPAEPGAVGAAEPRGDHAGLPAPDVRPGDRPGPDPGAAEVAGGVTSAGPTRRC